MINRDDLSLVLHGLMLEDFEDHTRANSIKNFFKKEMKVPEQDEEYPKLEQLMAQREYWTRMKRMFNTEQSEKRIGSWNKNAKKHVTLILIVHSNMSKYNIRKCRNRSMKRM